MWKFPAAKEGEAGSETRELPAERHLGSCRRQWGVMGRRPGRGGNPRTQAGDTG